MNVVDWLEQNDLYVSRADRFALDEVTFSDIKNGMDYSSVETLLHDAIYDGAKSLTKRVRK